MNNGALPKLLAFDQELSAKIRFQNRQPFLRRLAIFFAHSGDSWFCLIVLALVWFFGHQPWKNTALMMIIGVIVTAGIVSILKFTIRRKRPEGDWGNIYRKTDPHSFPSGHAARTFMLAVLACAMGPLWLGLLLWIWAPLVILSRVAMGVHYLSDVVIGAVLGIGIGIILLQLQPQLLSIQNIFQF